MNGSSREGAVLSLSVVVPMFNEAQNVSALLARLKPVVEAVTSDWQILLVDDGSTDGTPSHVREAAREEPRIELLALARNFGHQMALSAGLDHARGQVVVTMDGDLQHPPELIGQMLSLYLEGNDVVYTVRSSEQGASTAKRWSSGLFYRIFNLLSPVRILEASSDFRLLSRSAVDCLKAMPERHRFLRGLLPWTGLRSAVIPYDPEKRFAGSPKYSALRSLSMGLDAALSFSRLPLRMATLMGLLTTLACFAYFVFSLAKWWRGSGDVVWGWTSLIATTLFIGGVQLVCVGLLGEYVGRIYEEVKRRPLYVVQEHFRSRPGIEGRRDPVGRGLDAATATPPLGEGPTAGGPVP